MADRTCVKCGSEMVPIKNGFYYLIPTGYIYTSDLWGCYKCMHYQIHGSPEQDILKIHGVVHSGHIESDQGEMAEAFKMITEPQIEYTNLFYKHMKEWYPDWKY